MAARLSWFNLILLSLWVMATGCAFDLHMGDAELPDTETGSSADTSASDDASGYERFAFSDNLQNQRCPDYYELVAIPTLGGQYAAARGINDQGWVMGSSDKAEVYTTGAFIWKPDEANGRIGETYEFLEEGLPNGEEFEPSIIYDANSHGEVVGIAWWTHPSGFDGSWARPFYWSEEHGMELLPGNNVEAINEDGIVVGNGIVEEGEDRFSSGHYWTPEDGATYLPRLPGAFDWAGSILYDINDAGLMVGGAEDAWGERHGTKYTPGAFFSKLPNYPNPWIYSYILAEARAVNNHGQMVGGSRARPILWEANGEMHDLGILAWPTSLNRGTAEDINDAGVVIGSDGSGEPGVGSYPWVWCGGIKRSLESVVQDADDWSFAWVAGINNGGENNAGLIAVNGSNSQHAAQTALLFPVFEGPDGAE